MRNFIATIFLVFLISCNPDQDISLVSTDLIAYDLGSGTGLMGSARITFYNNLATINISLINQTPGSIRAVHIYNGSCEEPGDIWNGYNELNYCEASSNGEKWFKPNLGDVGNVVINNEGLGEFELTTDLWTAEDLVGKLIIVHAGPVNFLEECDPNHIPDHFHPNTKVACGTFF